MHTSIKITFHNRFEIEVRDKDTGELKQHGVAENIVLNSMYTRLCNLNNYFANIAFGTGTGTLSPTRTTLFSYLGYKSATTVETIKAYPVSKWTRKIVLNPEEFVGSAITEVGISNTYPSVNTHAMIKDAEGNPLSVLKTDLDVLTIYATVFIQLQHKSETTQLVDLPGSNSLLNYLCGSSGPDSTIALYKDPTLSKTVDATLITSKTAAKTSDVANRKVTYSTRFGISEGNGPVRKLGMPYVFATVLPDADVFTDLLSTNVALGVGDGTTRRFNVPTDRPDLKEVAVKVNNEVVTNFTIEMLPNINLRVNDIRGTISHKPRGVWMSADGLLIIVYDESGYFYAYKFDANYNRTALYEIYNSGGGRGVAGWQDGSIIILGASVYKYVTETDTYTKIQTLPQAAEAASISTDGRVLATAASNTPRYALYYWNQDTEQYVLLPDAVTAAGFGESAAVSSDGTLVIMVGADNSNVYDFDVVNNVATLRQTITYSGTAGSDPTIIISSNKNTLLVCTPWGSHTSVYTLNTTSGLYEFKQRIGFQLGNTASASMSVDAKLLMTHITSAGRFELHRLNTLTDEYESVPVLAEMLSASWSYSRVTSDNRLVTFLWDAALLCRIWDLEPRTTSVIFDSPPVEGASITIDYLTEYIPKTSDYVLDVNTEIIFGEGV